MASLTIVWPASRSASIWDRFRQTRVTRCEPVVFSLRQMSLSGWSSCACAGADAVLATVGTSTTCMPSPDALLLAAVPLPVATGAFALSAPALLPLPPAAAIASRSTADFVGSAGLDAQAESPRKIVPSAIVRVIPHSFLFFYSKTLEKDSPPKCPYMNRWNMLVIQWCSPGVSLNSTCPASSSARKIPASHA